MTYKYIDYRCPEHQADRLRECQEKVEHDYNYGDYVKVSIDCRDPDKDKMSHIESMWVQVLTVNKEERTITGKLANNPVRVGAKHKYGDKITVKFSEICDFLPQYYVR